MRRVPLDTADWWCGVKLTDKFAGFTGILVKDTGEDGLVFGTELGSNIIKLRCGFSPSESAATRSSQVTYDGTAVFIPYYHLCNVFCISKLVRLLKKNKLSSLYLASVCYLFGLYFANLKYYNLYGLQLRSIGTCSELTAPPQLGNQLHYILLNVWMCDVIWCLEMHFLQLAKCEISVVHTRNRAYLVRMFLGLIMTIL